MTVSPKIKSILKFVLKISISAIALYFVFKKVDPEETFETLSEVNIFYFLLAVLVFNISKIISIFRLKYLLKDMGVYINDLFNLKLYYIGAFYNLFLPGSIGGDGYKIYLIKQKYQGDTRPTISAIFLDRLSGLVALVVITAVFLLLSSYEHHTLFYTIVIGGMILAYPAYYLFLYLFFKRFRSSFMPTNYISFISQVLQVVCAYLILVSLNVPAHYMDYLSLFMVSSVLAVVPFTIGGLGAREVVFLLGYQYLLIDKHTAIAFTLLFFTVTTISSLIGLIFSLQNNLKPEPEVVN